jgi:hypothetical protein
MSLDGNETDKCERHPLRWHDEMPDTRRAQRFSRIKSTQSFLQSGRMNISV